MRKPLHILSAAILLATVGMGAANASSYQFKLPLKGIAPPADWQPHEPLYGDWEDVGDVFGCSNWAPAPMTVAVDQPFTQTATDCQQDQARTVQPRERDTRSGAIRNAGEPFTETRTLTASATRDAVGALESWAAADPAYTAWVNSGAVYACSNWSPAPETVTVGQAFTQTATDCQQDQTRTRQDREYEPTLGEYRNVGEPVIETQTIAASSSREAVGTLESWAAITPVYTDWANSGSVYGCTNWSPSEMTVAVGQVFTQTATDCKQDQTRTRQDREQEATTKAIRNVGSPVTETQTIAASSTRSATGTKESWSAAEAIYSSWTNSGSVYNCSAWSPDASTVTAGTTFTQTRSCSQNQTRTRQDREYEPTLGQYRNVGAPVTETQTITVSQSQQATGTKASYIYSPPQTYAYCVAGVVQGGRQGTGNVIRYNGVNVFQAWVPTVGACIFAPGKEFEGNDGHTYVIGAKSGAEFSVLRR